MKKNLPFLVSCFLALVSFNSSAQAPNWQWAAGAGGFANDYGHAIAVDGNGNCYATGSFIGPSITFGTTTLTTAGLSDFFIVKYDASGNVVWARGAGGSGADFGNGIAVDGSGNSYATGYFDSPSITFGTTTLTTAGLYDIFIVKYDAAGNVVWATNAGGSGDDYGNGIAVDGSGNSYVTGGFESPSITFGTATLTNADSGSTDFFIVKYDTAGNVVWANGAGGSGSLLGDIGYGIAVDGSGNCYVTGNFSSPSITFDTITLTNAGFGNDIFTVKYDASGNAVWANGSGGSTQDYGRGIVVDGTGNIYLTGWFYSPSITFGTTTLTNAGSADIFILKYDAAGNVVWAKGAGGSNPDYSKDIAVDGSDNIYVTGWFGSLAITFDTNTLTSAGLEDIFTVKYDPAGNVVWATSVGGSNYDWGQSIAVDGSGNSYLTGNFKSLSITFGTTTLTNAGVYDVFVAKLGSTVTAVAEVEDGGDVRVYPNPATSEVRIQSSELRIKNVEIVNVFGQQVFNSASDILHSALTIDVSSLAPGIYTVSIISDGNISVQKLIISK